MKKSTILATVVVLGVLASACNSDDAVITTTTADASQLTTTTTAPASDTTTPPDTSDTTGTTVQPGDPVDTYDIISRQSSEDGETLYILVPPGDYTDISIENFLGTLLEEDPAVFGAEVFDDREAIDAALKAESERTADELQAIEDHHLVSLRSGTQVEFQGPMSDFDDFVIGS